MVSYLLIAAKGTNLINPITNRANGAQQIINDADESSAEIVYFISFINLNWIHKTEIIKFAKNSTNS